MNETLRLLYDRFYTSPSMVESEQEVETRRKHSPTWLYKQSHRLTDEMKQIRTELERKLVLRIIDAQNLMIEQRSVDSFICGFRLAWEMANELKRYLEERPEPEDDIGPDALA